MERIPIDVKLNIYRASSLADVRASREQMITDTEALQADNPAIINAFTSGSLWFDRLVAGVRRRPYHQPGGGLVIIPHVEHQPSKRDRFGHIIISDANGEEEMSVRLPNTFEMATIRALGGSLNPRQVKSENWYGGAVINRIVGANLDTNVLINVIDMNITLGTDAEQRALQFVTDFFRNNR